MLKRLREKEGGSQREFAKKKEISLYVYKSYESGKARISESFWRQIKKELEEVMEPYQNLLFLELSLYNCDRPELFGLEQEFLSSPRLDDLTSVKACVDGLLMGEGRKGGVDMAVLFDHEEVGSRTKNGAGSVLLPILMEKICRSFGYTDEDCLNSRLRSFFLSVDVATCRTPEPAQ